MLSVEFMPFKMFAFFKVGNGGRVAELGREFLGFSCQLF